MDIICTGEVAIGKIYVEVAWKSYLRYEIEIGEVFIPGTSSLNLYFAAEVGRKSHEEEMLNSAAMEQSTAVQQMIAMR